MSKGFVYVLSNECMPGLVKIGRTKRSVSGRARELYSTGVAQPFNVVEEVFSPDCIALERLIHEELQDHRVSDAREFFKVQRFDAVAALARLHRQQVLDLVQEFLPDHTVVNPDDHLAVDEIWEVVSACNLHPFEFRDALSMMTEDDAKPIVDRYWKWRECRRRKFETANVTSIAERLQ